MSTRRHPFPRFTSLLAGLILSASVPALAQESEVPIPPDLTAETALAVMSRAVDDVIRPGYRAFEASADKLAGATTATEVYLQFNPRYIGI